MYTVGSQRQAHLAKGLQIHFAFPLLSPELPVTTSANEAMAFVKLVKSFKRDSTATPTLGYSCRLTLIKISVDRAFVFSTNDRDETPATPTTDATNSKVQVAHDAKIVHVFESNDNT